MRSTIYASKHIGKKTRMKKKKVFHPVISRQNEKDCVVFARTHI